MRTISLRQFRDSIPDLHEPVEVNRRTKAGDYETLGQWTPALTAVVRRPAPSAPSLAIQQAERDAILGRIRKGKA